MHWYNGSIAEAVTLSKQRNAIFVVFVEGDNDLSTEMAQTIDDAAVLKRLANEKNFLAVKLNSGSPNYTHFAQIYQFVPVPSLFFIGRNGTPLEVVCAGVQADNLASRIDRILQEHHNDKQTTIQPSTSAHDVKEQSANLLQSEAAAMMQETPKPEAVKQVHPVKPSEAMHQDPSVALQQSEGASVPVSQKSSLVTPRSEVAPEPSEPAAKVQKTEHHEVTKSGQEYDVVCDGDVCVRKPKIKADDPGPSQRPPVVDPIQPEATSLDQTETGGSVEEKMERAKELIEVRRREKADKEKELEKEREKERRATGQGVAELKRWQADEEMRQIQEDRKREKMENNMARQRILEQIAQDRAERRARDAPAPPPAQPAQPAVPAGDGGARARIQFKLPDGTSHTAHFDADGSLADVHRYVADNLQQVTSPSFSLWTAFPRRELTQNEATLRDLQLTPSAALLVLPRRAAATVAAPGTFETFIAVMTTIFTTYILQPTQHVYSWVYQRLFPGRPRMPPARPQDPPRDPPASGVRRRGNIHRFPGERAGDDDNNTWNGNSTQQM